MSLPPALIGKAVLVTGAAGFIGSRVSALLQEAGAQVVAVDNFNDAYDPRLKTWRWAQLKAQGGLELVELDVARDREKLQALFSQHEFHAVLNLAARAGVRASVENPGVYVETNLAGWVNLLEMGRKFGVKKFVLASTSSLYGKHHPTPYREDMLTDHPLSPYAATKKAAEVMAYTYAYLQEMDFSLLRYFTVYGPAGRPDMAPFRFVQRIREGRPITVYGDGRQSRDFTYVDDIARGTIAALRPNASRYEIFNLGSDQPLLLNEMIAFIEERTGLPAQKIFQPGHPADMDATWADITKARRDLNWAPQTDFRTGMQNLLDWYEKNRSWASEIKTD